MVSIHGVNRIAILALDSIQEFEILAGQQAADTNHIRHQNSAIRDRAKVSNPTAYWNIWLPRPQKRREMIIELYLIMEESPLLEFAKV